MTRTRSPLLTPFALGIIALNSGPLPGIMGQVALWPALGIFPGMPLALLLGWRRPAQVRGLLGVTLAPLIAALLGWVLACGGMSLGAAAIATSAGSWLAWVALEFVRMRRPPAETIEDPDEPAAVRILSWTFGIAVALPLLFNAWLRVHGDGWVHGGLVWEIVRRGFPPQDPRFAGQPLSYVWFYHLYLALLTSVRGQDPLGFMAIQNVVLVAWTARVAFRLGYAVWRDRDAASGSALLLTIGFNALAWLLWPLRLLTALTGDVRGMEDVRRVIHDTYLFDDRVFFTLSAPYAHTVSFLDKFLLGTPLTYAWLLVLVYLWALAEWTAEARREALVLGALCPAGIMLFHFVPGLAVPPAVIGALMLAAILRRRWPWLPETRRLVAFAIASALGLAVVLPYTISILRGWNPGSTGLREPLLRIRYVTPWTLLTSCAVALAFAWRPLRRLWSERRAQGVLLAFAMALVTALALVIHLTEDNESKLVILCFFPLAVIGGAAVLPWFRALMRRSVPLAMVAIAMLTAHEVLMLVGYAADPRGKTAGELDASPAVVDLYRWMRDSTDTRAVFVDHRFRDLIMVRGQRRLYYGSTFGPERAGFPIAQVTERRAVMADLFGPASELDQDAAALRRIGAPTYVLFRAEDFARERRSEPLGEPLARRPDLFAPAYARDGYRVFALR